MLRLRIGAALIVLSLVFSAGCSARGLRAFAAVTTAVVATVHLAQAIARAVDHSHHHGPSCGHRRVVVDGRAGYRHGQDIEYWDPHARRWYRLERRYR